MVDEKPKGSALDCSATAVAGPQFFRDQGSAGQALPEHAGRGRLPMEFALAKVARQGMLGAMTFHGPALFARTICLFRPVPTPQGWIAGLSMLSLSRGMADALLNPLFNSRVDFALESLHTGAAGVGLHPIEQAPRGA